MSWPLEWMIAMMEGSIDQGSKGSVESIGRGEGGVGRAVGGEVGGE